MNKLAITIAMTVAFTLAACGKSGETENHSSGAPTSMTGESEQSIGETATEQEAIQSEQAAFEAIAPAGGNENTGSTISSDNQ